jgi:hypothetical protein
MALGRVFTPNPTASLGLTHSSLKPALDVTIAAFQNPPILIRRKQAKHVQNNPAARLYDLTRRLRSTSRNEPPARLWAQAFDIPINSEMTGPPFFQVVQQILAFLELLNETEAGILELEFDDFYWEAFPPLRRVVQNSLSNLRTNQSNLTGPITDETLTLLRVIAAQWEKNRPDPEIDEEVLKEIWAEAHSLFEAVKRAEIDSQLKRLILSLTSEIEQAIQQYRIGGPEGLKRALALIVGQANLNIEIVDKAGTDQRGRVWWRRFYNVAVKLFEVVKFANNTRETIGAMSPLLRLFGAPDEIPPVDIGAPGKR